METPAWWEWGTEATKKIDALDIAPVEPPTSLHPLSLPSSMPSTLRKRGPSVPLRMGFNSQGAGPSLPQTQAPALGQSSDIREGLWPLRLGDTAGGGAPLTQHQDVYFEHQCLLVLGDGARPGATLLQPQLGQ